ncbi:MAG: DNRLRE domain-containing protein [Puia sp.]
MNKNLVSFLSLLLCLVFVGSCKKDHTNKVPVADAGPSMSTTPPKDSVTLTGSGTDADGKISSYLWSQVSGPNSSLIANPSSANTLLSGLITGTYVLQLMVVDNQGATGVDTVSIVVNPSPIDTLNVQPEQNQNEVMIWGNSTNLEESWAGSPETGGAAWTSGNPVFERGALQFDLSQIAKTATIMSANLYLYSESQPINGDLVHSNSGADNSLLVQQITQPWVASAVKWTNQPSSTETDEVIVPSTTSASLDLNIDVKALVANMVSQNENYGFLLKLQTETAYTSRLFCSSFNSDTSKHPKLVVVYKY